ncbi:MAG: hypothetical protein JOZ53_14325 [Planctomycetaceae bacterium]|nr:hypothetical protein [Planctomycetaceae bacterium]
MRARGAVVAPVDLQGDPLPRPGPGSTPRPGRFVSGTAAYLEMVQRAAKDLRAELKAAGPGQAV